MMQCIILVWLHFIGDFILQTDQMALNKSKSHYWLGLHCLVYMLPLFAISPTFAIVNASTHFLIDALTSRAGSYLWSLKQRKAFFIVVGFDQALHLTILFATYELYSS